MATTFYNEKTSQGQKVALTTFFGGERFGRCLALTVNIPGVKSAEALMTETEVLRFRDQLNDWLSRRNAGLPRGHTKLLK